MSFAAHVERMDRLVLSHLGEGESVITYMPRSGPYAGETTPLSGAVFQSAYQLAAIGEAGVSTTTPALFVRESALPGYGEPNRDFDEDDPIITRAEVEYSVREAQPDGEGGVWFLLREVR